MTFHLLVVCSANVCRSPFAGAALAQAFADAGHSDEVVVDTAGVAALEGQGACPEITLRMQPGPAIQRRLAAHSSRQLTVFDVEKAGLVLTADRAVRAAVVRMAPRLQSRVFTLRQMADLTTVDAGVRRSPPPASDTLVRASEVLEQFATLLDLARGGAPGRAARSRQMPWRRRVVAHPHDVLDAHRVSGSHTTTAILLRESVERVSTSFVEALNRTR